MDVLETYHIALLQYLWCPYSPPCCLAEDTKSSSILGEIVYLNLKARGPVRRGVVVARLVPVGYARARRTCREQQHRCRAGGLHKGREALRSALGGGRVSNVPGKLG